MNYTNIYKALVSKRKKEPAEAPFERHHIVPKCLKGTDEKNNIVHLTPEEHYIAHLLLCKIHPGDIRLVRAALMMCVDNSNQQRNNKAYGYLKRKWSQHMKDHNPSTINGTWNRGLNRRLRKTPIQDWEKEANAERMRQNNPNADGKIRSTKTYLIDENTKKICYTFNSLKEAEEEMADIISGVINHTSVYLNRKKDKAYKGYYWCVGEKEYRETINK